MNGNPYDLTGRVAVVTGGYGVLGGGLAGRLIKRGWTVNRSRKTAMFLAAAMVVPTIFAPRAPNMWTAVAMVSLAAAK